MCIDIIHKNACIFLRSQKKKPSITILGRQHIRDQTLKTLFFSSGYTALRENVDYLWPIQFGSSAAKDVSEDAATTVRIPVSLLYNCSRTEWESDSMI